jgi:hypothetical protein
VKGIGKTLDAATTLLVVPVRDDGTVLRCPKDGTTKHVLRLATGWSTVSQFNGRKVTQRKFRVVVLELRQGDVSSAITATGRMKRVVWSQTKGRTRCAERVKRAIEQIEELVFLIIFFVRRCLSSELRTLSAGEEKQM